jgi:hypothetical protein
VRLAIATLAGSLAAIAACNGSPVVQTRTITVHAPAACAPSEASAYAVFEPLGDFQPGAALSSLPLSQTGSVLAGFPSDTAEIVLTVTDTTQWEGHAVLSGAGGIDLLALPAGTPCALSDAISARTAFALGAIDEGHALIAGGTSTTGVPRTAVVDLTRGTVSELPVGLLVPRTNASVTAWSGGAVVAGGLQLDASTPSFEIYSSSVGDFDGATHPLSQARSRHGAVVMANGETLLVGGVDPGGNVLGSMEAIDAAHGVAITGGLGLLQVPRADPVVMRLASGEILVAGGVDGTGEPVSTLEWFPADGSPSTKPPQQLVAALNEAFVPLPAGGALAVIAPATPATGFQNVWVISADDVLQPATPIVTLSEPSLLAGTGGAPVLWTGDRWLVWQPWVGAFTDLASAIGAPGPTGDPITGPEPGLGVWFDGTTVHALRFGTRGPYAATPTTSPFLLTDTSSTAPDQLVTTGAAGQVSFDPGSGLTLQPGASVFVTDATFGSFALDAQTPGKAPPAIVLRDDAGNETVLDTTSCAIAPGSTLHVERDGNVIEASVDGGALVTCMVAPAPGARVSIGVRGVGTGASVVAGIAITRT